jgi:hypothetical protein
MVLRRHKSSFLTLERRVHFCGRVVLSSAFWESEMAEVLDERRLAIVMRQHNLGKPNGAPYAPAKLDPLPG